MKKFDVQELLEVRESLKTQELKERIDKILRMLEEGEMFDLTEDGKVIAHVVPASEPKLSREEEVSEPKQSREEEIKAFWADMRQLAAQVGAYLPEKVDAVEIVRNVRRDL